MDYFSLQNGPFSAAIFTGFRFSASSRISSSAVPKSANDFSKETRIRKRESSRGSCLQASSLDRYCLESPLSVANCSWLKFFSCRHAISVLLKADWTFFLRYIEINAIKSPRKFPQPKDCKKKKNGESPVTRRRGPVAASVAYFRGYSSGCFAAFCHFTVKNKMYIDKN